MSDSKNSAMSASRRWNPFFRMRASVRALLIRIEEWQFARRCRRAKRELVMERARLEIEILRDRRFRAV